MSTAKGYTLIELVVAMSSATVLMVGLSGAIFAASQAMDVDEGASYRRNESGAAIAGLLAEVEEARSFTTLNATTAEFLVPDRTGDGVEETIRYAWSGVAGDALTRSVNGGAAAVLLRDVRSLSFLPLTRSVTATSVVASAAAPPQVQDFSISRISSGSARELDLTTPTGVVAGELLLASLSIDGRNASSLTLPAGWNELDRGEGGFGVTLGMAWKIATASEPPFATWSWSRSEKAIGWVLRISNHGVDPAAPATFPTVATNDGAAATATCPAATVAADNSLVVRIGAFDDDDNTPTDVGMAGHVPVLMSASSSGIGTASGGCAYTTEPVAGTTPSATFNLLGSEEFRTATVVIRPEN